MSNDWADLSYLDVFRETGLAADDLDMTIDAVSSLEESLWPSLLHTCLAFPETLVFILSALPDVEIGNYMSLLTSELSARPSSIPSSLSAKVLRAIVDELASPLFQNFGRLQNKYKDDVSHCLTVLSIIASNEVDALVETQSAVRDTQHFALVGGQGRHHASAIQDTEIGSVVTALGYSLPTTRHEWQKLSHGVSRDLCHILRECIVLLRQSKTVSILRSRRLGMSSELEESTQAEEDSSLLQDNFAHVVSDTFSLHTVQSFGDWPVLLSMQAATDIRKSRQRSIKEAEKIVKKIRELSRGEFTKDNQVLLKNSFVDSDVYRAWVMGDIRLVYYIDCVDDSETNVQIQAIKVLGIHSLSQMKDERMWERVTRQLSGRPKEEKQRARARAISDGCYVPIKFPRLAEQPASAAHLLPLDSSIQADEESMLDYQKYIVFSQAYLSSVLADKDLTLPFAPGSEELKIIGHPSSCYVYGRSGTGKTTAIVYKMIARDRCGAARQIFLTKSPVLAERVQEHFRKLKFSLSAAHMSPQELEGYSDSGNLQQPTLIHARDRVAGANLPAKFGDLKTKDFPLFITVEQLMTMLEADLLLPGGRVTSYVEFLRHAWPQFPANLTKRIDPALVWSQILGVIKGSEDAMRSEYGCLNRNAYVNEVSRDARAMFSTDSERHRVYDIFEQYRKWQRGRDAADRTRSLLTAMQGGSLLGKRADFVYIDEVQDILLVEALVLFSLCANEHGLLWAGDTAQTISTGSAFRFAELKALVWRAMSQVQGPSAASVGNAWKDFQLSLNYRSHAGIVNCAASLVKLLIALWPASIDQIGEERGFVDGPRPVFFPQGVQDATSRMKFLKKEDGRILDFGAEQCIIVRDDEARLRLLSELGDVPGLVFTVLDSKGLEFDDVLLLNFFRDSHVDQSQWRRAIQSASQIAFQGPSDTRIQSICYELKSLYVAVTRARKTLWIIDESDCGEPLMSFWSDAGLIEIGTSQMRMASSEESNTKAAWKARAATLFEAGHFAQAEWAFVKAGCDEEAAISHAHVKRQQAEEAQSRNDPSAPNLYLSAARDFAQRAKRNPISHHAYMSIAADCFDAAGQHLEAAEVLFSINEFDQAALQYLKGMDVDRAMDMLKRFKQPNDRVYHAVTEAAKLAYMKRKDFQLASPLFHGSSDAMSAFVEEHEELSEIEADFLVWTGKVVQGAMICLSKGEDKRGLDLLFRDPSDAKRMDRIVSHIISTLRTLLSFGITAKAIQDARRSARVKLLLDFSLKVASHIVDQDNLDDLILYRAIYDHDLEQLQQLVSSWASNERAERRVLIALDHIFSSEPMLRSTDPAEVLEMLRQFFLYDHLAKRLSTKNPQGVTSTVKVLFAVRVNTSFKFDLTPGTFVHKWAKEHTLPGARSSRRSSSTTHLSKTELEEQIATAVRSRLIHRVQGLNAECERLYSLSPLDHEEPNALRNWQERSLSLAGLHLDIVDLLPPREPEHPHTWISRFFDMIYAGPESRSVAPYHTLRKQCSEHALGLLTRLSEKVIVSLAISDRDCVHRFVQAMEVLRCLNVRYLVRKPKVLDRAPILKPFVRPSQTYDVVRGSYALEDLIGLHFGDFESSVASGVGFLDQVLRHQLQVDVMFLACFIENLCGAVVVMWSYQQKESLHSIKLQKDVLVATLNKFSVSSVDTLSTDLVIRLCQHVQAIMNIVHDVKSSWGWMYRNQLLRDVESNADIQRVVTKSMFTSLRLVGATIDDIDVRSVIQATVKANYITCESATMFSFADIARNVPDGLVDLVESPQSTRPKFVSDGPMIKKVVYHHPEHILDLLLGRPLRRVVRSDPQPGRDGHDQSGPHVSPDAHSTVKRPPSPSGATVDVVQTSDVSTTVDAVAGAVQAIAPPDLSETGEFPSADENHTRQFEHEDIIADELHDQDILERFTDTDLLVLAQLAGIYTRRQALVGTQTSYNEEDEDRRGVVAEFQAHALKTDWSDARKYCLLYRSIVPYAYFAATSIVDHAEREKKEAKQDYSAPGAADRQTMASRILKKAKPLQKELAPSSPIHAKKDLPQLRKSLEKMYMLVVEASLPQASVIANDVQTALAAIDKCL